VFGDHNEVTVNDFYVSIFTYAKRNNKLNICKYLTTWCKYGSRGHGKRQINLYKMIEISNDILQEKEKSDKKAGEKWQIIPPEIWIKIVDDYFHDDGEKTHYIFKMAKVSTQFYRHLLFNKEVMKMFSFTLKNHETLSKIVEKCEPRYKIRNLSLIYIKLTNKFCDQFSHLSNAKFFQLHKLDLSFTTGLKDSCISHIPKNIEVLHMVLCSENQMSEIAFSKFTNLRELNISARGGYQLTDKVFKSIGKNLKKLIINLCDQFTNQIFTYLPKDCYVEAKGLNLNRNLSGKRKRENN
jgi:hypothetical protein